MWQHVPDVEACCSVLPHFVACCSVLQCDHKCPTSQRVAEDYSVLQCVAVCCSMLHSDHMCPTLLLLLVSFNSLKSQRIALFPPQKMETKSTWVLFCTPTNSNTLQHTTTHCNTLQHTTTHCNTQHYTATHCNTLQHTATHCNTLQHTATHKKGALKWALECLSPPSPRRKGDQRKNEKKMNRKETYYSHVWICRTHEWVMSHIWKHHVTHMNESCQTYE